MDYAIVAASIDDAQAAEMRARLASFVEDWEGPDMTRRKPRRVSAPAKQGYYPFTKL